MAHQHGNLPLIEVYWSLVDKADKKFSKIRDLPLYERHRYDTYFYKVFKVYTQLWKFQQENRQRLVEAGLKRWEIGEIASRIAQIYFGQYMHTSDGNYLSESYVFYEAILTREYFKEGLLQDFNIANKQLRFLARFIMVCLLLNRQEMVHELVNQLKTTLDECKRTFQDSNLREWKLVVQEIVKFLKANSVFMNIRPLRYSLVLDAPPDSAPHLVATNTKRNLRLRDAILSSYHPNEVKFSELNLDAYRMLQCLEWEPSGSFYKSGMAASSGTAASLVQNGTSRTGCTISSQDITDPTLPPNPRKAILYRPSALHFLADKCFLKEGQLILVGTVPCLQQRSSGEASFIKDLSWLAGLVTAQKPYRLVEQVLATVCEELPSDGVLFIYLSGRGRTAPGSIVKNLQSQTPCSDMICKHDNESPPSEPFSNFCLDSHFDSIQIGSRGNEGTSCIYPCDFLPFTRRPLFIVVDSESSVAFKILSGAERGEPAAMLLSPCNSPPTKAGDSSRQQSGNLFTMFLTVPVQAFCRLHGHTGSDNEKDKYENAEKILSSSLKKWETTLATASTLSPVWAQILCDPFLRRLLLRFIFCRAALALYAPTINKVEYIPQCMPHLPEDFLPSTTACQSVIWEMATMFGASRSFNFLEDIMAGVSVLNNEI